MPVATSGYEQRSDRQYQAGGGPGRVRGAQRARLGPPHDSSPVGARSAQRGAGGFPAPAGPPKSPRDRAAWRLFDGPAAWPGADRAGDPAAVAASAAARGRGP